MVNQGAAAHGDDENAARSGNDRRAPLKRAGAVVITAGCLLAVASLWVPWVTIVMPAHFGVPGRTVIVRAVDGSPGGAPFIMGCPGLGLVLPLVVLVIAAFDVWRRGAARAPLPLVGAAALIGLICAPLLLIVATVSSMTLCCVRGPSEVMLVGGGMLLAVAGYGTCLVGCILAIV